MTATGALQRMSAILKSLLLKLSQQRRGPDFDMTGYISGKTLFLYPFEEHPE